ncbi:hypothetical protein Droror1_Dr00027001 [Drosera rotundifolia]
MWISRIVHFKIYWFFVCDFVSVGKIGSDSIVVGLCSVNSGVGIDPKEAYTEFWMGTHESGPPFVVESERDLMNGWCGNGRVTRLSGSASVFFSADFDVALSVVTLTLTILTSSQAILIVWSKRAGKYEYSVRTANFLVESVKCALSLTALAKIWQGESITEDSSTTFEEVRVYPIPAAHYLVKNMLQYYIFAYVDAPGYQILKNFNIISTG